MGASQNNDYTSYLAGKVYVATMPTGIPIYTVGTNEVAVQSYLEANCTFTRLFGVTGLEIVNDFGAQTATIRGDECDYQEAKYARVPTAVNFDYLENLDPEAFAIATGNTRLNVASAPVAVTTEIILAASSGSVAKGAVYVLSNKNGDNTVATSIVVDVDGTPLVLDTGYSVNVDTDGSATGEIGQTYITFLLATTTDKQVDVDYSYTPNATEYTGVKNVTVQLPQLVVKIVGCPDSSGNFNTHYVVNASLTGTWTMGFVDLATAGNPVASTIGFATNFGGFSFAGRTRL